jgi:uncharacterized protein DUF664
MTLSADLQRYLQQSRDTVVSKLDGLSEYDIRRPVMPSGTNLLGLIKHLASVEHGYLVESPGRSSDLRFPWNDDGSVWESADMWALPSESREYLVDLYRSVWKASDASIAELDLSAPATVAWWPEERRNTTFGALVVRMVAETGQHAGHADIIRETIDGRGGKDHDDIGDAAHWSEYVAKIQAAADTFKEAS